MLVKALREHNNTYGDKVRKTVDSQYDLPEPMAQTLIRVGLVAEVPAKEAKGK